MLRVVREDIEEDEAPGSVLGFCQGLLTSAGKIVDVLQDDDGTEKRVDEQLELLQLWAEQATEALLQCKEHFKRATATVQKADALLGAVQVMEQAALDLQNQRKRQTTKQPKQSAGLCSCLAPKAKPKGSSSQAYIRKMRVSQEDLQKTVDVIRTVDSAEDHYIFGSWLPNMTIHNDPFYKRPVAFDTVTTYLLAQKLPARILIHGPSGNGKTSLLRQLQCAINDEDHPLHPELGKRFSGGLKWVDCGILLRMTAQNFAIELKQKALALAQDLLPHEDDRLVQMDLLGLAAVIKDRITHGPFVVVFDNVWDGGIFRRDFLNVLPDESQGTIRRGTILVTSQLNLSSICQWHSPETITIPLSAESNLLACSSLLASLWSADPHREDLPEPLQGVARKLVKECQGSPLAIRLLAPLLQGSTKDRKWREVHASLVDLVRNSSFRRNSSGSEDGQADVPKVMYAFQLRAEALPSAMRQLLSVFTLFPPSQQIPAAAVLAVHSHTAGLPLEECTVLLVALAKACYVDIKAPLGHLLSGTVSYHGLLKQFMISLPDYRGVLLPGTATQASSLCLAVTVIYAVSAYKQQALQVFSKLKQEDDIALWEQPPQNRRNPFLEPFWLQLLSLTSDPELGLAARAAVVSAARQLASLSEMSDALRVLFTDARALLAAAGVFSELAWQVQDRQFLQVLAGRVEEVQAVSRVVMRLRELTAREGTMTQAEELTVLAWALADLAECLNSTSRLKLRSEPVIPLLRSCYQGAAVYAYQRLHDTLELDA